PAPGRPARARPLWPPHALRACLAALVWALPASAQEGVVQGRVHDAAGAAVSGAAVSLVPADVPDAPARAVGSDPLGSFRISGVETGAYRLTVGARGDGEAARAVA